MKPLDTLTKPCRHIFNQRQLSGLTMPMVKAIMLALPDTQLCSVVDKLLAYSALFLRSWIHYNVQKQCHCFLTCSVKPIAIG